MHRNRCFCHDRKVICQHQIEIEVWPSHAEVYFSDERYADGLTATARFEACVYNTPTGRVRWTVLGPAGGPGYGTIDQNGTYTAPAKGSIPSGATDVIAAQPVDDLTRIAFAYVTLIGKGPLPRPRPRITVVPGVATIYDMQVGLKGFMDISNKKQVFRAIITGSDDPVDWLVDSVVKVANDATRTFSFPSTEAVSILNHVATVQARLTTDHTVCGYARCYCTEYKWNGIVLP
jgi:hypothetical protein